MHGVICDHVERKGGLTVEGFLEEVMRNSVLQEK